MSKKTESFNFDDDEFNFDDFGDGSYKSTAKKSGARRVISDFTGGLVSGLKSAFLNPTNQRNFLEKNLPKGFVASFDAGSMTASAGKSVYDTTKDEVNKQLKSMAPDLKTINDIYGKKYAPKISKRVGNYLDGAIESSEDYKAQAEDDDRRNFSEETLAQLMESFARSSKHQAHATAAITDAQTDKLVSVGTSNLASLISANKLLTNLSNNSDRQVQYKLKVDSVLQRKAIELSFRQYTIQRQHLDVAQQTLSLQKEAFEALVKNTGLPEAIKMTNWELASRSIKTKLIGQATERFASTFASTGQRLLQRMQEGVKNNVGMMGGQLGLLATMGAMGAEMASSGMGGSKSSMAGQVGGNGLFWLLQHMVSKKYGDRLRGNKTLNKYSNMATNFMDSFPSKFNEMQESGGTFSRFMNMLGVGDILADDSARNKRVRGSGFSAFDELTSFNKHSQLALTEIIPGYLRMIQHDIAIMRSGDGSLSDQRYNMDKGTFESSTTMTNTLRNSVYNKQGLKDTRRQAQKVLESLDSKRQLSPRARKALLKYIIEQGSSDIGVIDPRRLLSDDSPIDRIDSRASEEIRDVLGNENNFNYRDGVDGNAYNSFSDKDTTLGNMVNSAAYQSKMADANSKLKDLRYNIPLNRNQTLKHASIGNHDLLKAIGVLKWNKDAKQWDYDESAYVNAVLGGGIPKVPGTPNAPTPNNPFRPPSGGGGNAAPPPREDPFGHGGDTYTPFQLELLETIQANSVKDSQSVTNELLESIRQRIEMGIPQGEPSSNADASRRTNWFRRMIDGASKVGGKLGRFARFGTIGAPMAIFKGIKSVGQGILNGISNSPSFKNFNDLKGAALDKLGDLYIRGRDGVVIKLSDLQAGKYFDEKTRKVIKKFSDIKGAIVDSDGNIIITEDEVKSKLYTMIKGKPFSIVGGMLRAGLSVISGLFNLNKMGMVAQFKFAKTSVQKVINLGGRLLSQAEDVYVVGESAPRLLANLMRNHAYFNRDGSVVKSPYDIRGDILDSQGNTLLSVSDISKGLVNKRGRPFKTITDRVKSLLRLPVTMAAASLRLAKKPFQWASRLFKWSIKGRSKKLHGNESASEVQYHIASSVDKIHDLLNDRLPKNPNRWNSHNGRGFRDGSRDDFFSRSRGKSDTTSSVKGKDDHRKGLFGMLSMIIGGIGGLVGTVKGWMGNLFGLVRGMAAARSGAGILGSLLGGAGAAKGASKGGFLRRIFSGIARSKLGKFVLGAGALYGLSQTSFASTAITGAKNAFEGNANNSQDEASRQAQSMMGMDSASGDPSVSGGADSAGYKTNRLSFMQRMKNAVGGSMIGEIGAVASAPLLYMGMNKLLSKTGLGNVKHEKAHLPANASSREKLIHFLTKTGKGRVLAAALTGGALFTGREAFAGPSDNTLGSSALQSYGGTLGLDAAMIASPLLWAKYGDKVKGMFGRKTPAHPMYHPHTVTGSGASVHRNPYINPTHTTPHQPVGYRFGGVKNVGRGLLKHAGLMGLGFAGLDAYNQEGGAWEKTKAFGSSLAQNILISKALGLVTKSGRASMVNGARGLASRLGSGALMQGGRAALMGGGEMLAGGATALAGLVSAPVVIGAAAIAAIGVGAWLGYKYFFKKDQNAIARFRMAQYGFDLDDRVKTTMVGQLEALCQKSVTYNAKGEATISKSVNTQAIIKIFNIPMNDKHRVESFSTWFQQRFKPVFLTALAAYKGITKNTDLEKADTLSKEQKITMVNQMANVPASPDPYQVMMSPFDNGKLKYNRSDVMSEMKVALRNLSHENGTTDKSTIQKMREKMSSVWDNTKKTTSGWWNDIKDVGNRVATAAGGIGSAIGDYAKNSWDNAKSAGSNLIHGNWQGLAGNISQQVSNVGQLVSDSWQSVKMMGGSTREKYNKVRSAAMQAGDPHPDIVAAQWAVESSWGSKQSGKWNFFGIKATGNQPGTMCPTHEVLGGRRVKVMAKFADYKSLDDGISARVNFIRANPRYTRAGYFSATTPAQAAMALVRGGYATDPNYALTLCKIIKGCGYDPNQPSPKAKDAKQLLKDNSNMRSGLTTAAGAFGATAQIGQGATTQARSTMTGANAQAQGYRNTATLTGTAATSFGDKSLVTAQRSGEVSISNDTAAFLRELSTQGALIALGKKATRLSNGVDINGMVKGFMVCFYAMVGEAVQKGLLTSVQVNSANRSIDKQKELYNQYLTKGHPLAAKPGSSNHNFGVAIDINSANAETLSRSGLLQKYHFHRPLLHHPTHPEPWHLENTLFAKRSKDTQKEVAKSVKDKSSSAKVDRAQSEVGKDSPVVKAEKTAKASSPTQRVVQPTGGFATQGAPQTDESIRRRPSDILQGRQQGTNTSEQASSSSVDKGKYDLDQQHASLLQQQLDIQTKTLQVLTQMHETLKGTSNNASTNKPTNEASNTQISGASQAADMFRGRTKDVPVQMSFTRK